LCVSPLRTVCLMSNLWMQMVGPCSFPPYQQIDRPSIPRRPCWRGPASMPAACCLWQELPSAVLPLCPPLPVADVGLRRGLGQEGLHPAPSQPAPLAWTSDAVPFVSSCRIPLLLVQPFIDSHRLLRHLLTSRSGWNTVALSGVRRDLPRIRTHSFVARPPDLRHRTLVTRASRMFACSPCSAPPSIRFLSIGPQVRSKLPPHTRSPSCNCASLRSL
jgi:hypothetical protein